MTGSWIICFSARLRSGHAAASRASTRSTCYSFIFTGLLLSYLFLLAAVELTMAAAPVVVVAVTETGTVPETFGTSPNLTSLHYNIASQ